MAVSYQLSVFVSALTRELLGTVLMRMADCSKLTAGNW
jgi:hypothetical protein